MRELEQSDITDSVEVDGDTTEAIFRAIVEPDSVEEMEAMVEDLEVDIEHTKYLGEFYGVEVSLR